MLSYILPMEEKSSTSPRNLNLNLDLNAGDATQGGILSSMAPENVNSNRNGSEKTCDKNVDSVSQFANTTAAPRDLKFGHNLRQQQLSADRNKFETNDGITNISETVSDIENCKNITKKGKLSRVGNKNVNLKRVSFGSSKGSMVETLVFETPTPLPEHAERQFVLLADSKMTKDSTTFRKPINHNNNNMNLANNNNNSTSLDDSGIEMQEELERSKVRVSFFQSTKPQQVSPPDSHIYFRDSTSPPSDNFEQSIINNDIMATATVIQPNYDRQISTESGWDNPFRPGGDLSREADEIVNMIKGGKPITPTGDNQSIANGSAQKEIGKHCGENGAAAEELATKNEVSQAHSMPAQNGTKSPQMKLNAGNKTNGSTKASAPQTQVSNQVLPGPISASHVVIEDKKKKKCTCCVIQ